MHSCSTCRNCLERLLIDKVFADPNIFSCIETFLVPNICGLLRHVVSRQWSLNIGFTGVTIKLSAAALFLLVLGVQRWMP